MAYSVGGGKVLDGWLCGRGGIELEEKYEFRDRPLGLQENEERN